MSCAGLGFQKGPSSSAGRLKESPKDGCSYLAVEQGTSWLPAKESFSRAASAAGKA